MVPKIANCAVGGRRGVAQRTKGRIRHTIEASNLGAFFVGRSNLGVVIFASACEGVEIGEICVRQRFAVEEETRTLDLGTHEFAVSRGGAVVLARGTALALGANGLVTSVCTKRTVIRASAGLHVAVLIYFVGADSVDALSIC